VADVVLGVPALPPRGDVLASAATVTAGGGFNVLAAAARQGMPAAYGGAHGTGPLADLTRAALAAEGIAVLLPPVPGLDTGFVITLVEPGGERTIVTSTGAEARLTPAALAAVTARPQDTVYLSGYGLAHGANRAALLGWLPGLPAAARLVFDPGPLGAQVPAAALEQVERRADWWAGNAAEADARTGETTPEAAVLALARRPGRCADPHRPGRLPAGRPGGGPGAARTAWSACRVPGRGGGHHRRGRHPPGCSSRRWRLARTRPPRPGGPTRPRRSR
jgi:sugar/nucleoside kinase (ribokinase family)